MPGRDVELIFDFASPNAYMAWRVLPGMLSAAGAGRVTITPCLLGGIFKATGNQAPMIAFGPIKGKMDYEMLEMRRFIARHRLWAWKMNPHFPVNTLLLMRGLVAAQMQGDATGYVEAGLKALWEDGLKMDDPAVCQGALEAAGLDGAGLMAGTQAPEVKAKLVQNTEAAVARGVFGIPTFFVGDEMFFGKERMGQVVEAAAA